MSKDSLLVIQTKQNNPIKQHKRQCGYSFGKTPIKVRIHA